MRIDVINSGENTLEIHGDRIRKFARDPEGLPALEKEAKNLEALHPIAPEFFRIGETKGGRKFLEMECRPGDTLQSKGKLSPFNQLPFAVSLAMAIKMVHNEGYVHRDIKPSNVLIDEQFEASLIDFSTAELIGKTSESKQTFVYGTTAYTPPEILLRMSDWNPSCDIFSFGATLYFAATGRRCFDGTFSVDIANSMVQGPSPVENSPLWPVIKNCVLIDPVDRYSDFREVIADLTRCVESKHVVDRSPSKEEISRRLKGRWTLFAKTIFASVMAFVIFTCSYLLFFSSSAVPEEALKDAKDGVVSLAIESNHVGEVTVLGEEGRGVKIRTSRPAGGELSIEKVPCGRNLIFYKTDDGQERYTIRLVPELNLRNFNSSESSILNSAFRAFGFRSIIENGKFSCVSMKGPRDVNQEAFLRMAGSNAKDGEIFEKKTTSGVAIELTELSRTHRIATLNEIKVLKPKKVSDYVPFEHVARRRIGTFLFVPRNGSLMKVVDFRELTAD